MSKAIVVGGGLSGLSAAHTILERGGNVLVLDKVSRLAIKWGTKREEGED